MSQTLPHNVEPKVTLVGDLASNESYDEAFLACSNGYCIFDAEQRLQAYSSDFPSHYPPLIEHINIGIRFEDYIRKFVETKAVQNLGQVDSVDDWVAAAVASLENKSLQYIHHLLDGRWMQIRMNRVSTGHWLFVSTDITEQRAAQEALKQSHHRFRTFAKLAMDWFWELDANLNYLYHSSEDVNLDGYEGNLMLGQSMIDALIGNIVQNNAWREYCVALRNHSEIDTVLEWQTDGAEPAYIHILASPQFNASNAFTGYMGCSREVTEDVLLKMQLNHIAEHDDLTGLVNRRAFELKLQETLRDSVQREKCATLCFLDLDQFKLVNDGGGHDAGDQLLIDIAEKFTQVLGTSALVARLGGDEFGVILPFEVNKSFQLITELIAQVSSSPFEWMQRKYTIGVSAGLVAIDSNSKDISECMSRADTACYIAKRAGRNQAQLYRYDEYFQDPVSLELKQVNLLRDAMDNGGLMLYLQPIKDIQQDQSHLHFEVLLRLSGSDGVVKSAGEFIPVAEKYDLMQHLDRWVVSNALSTLASLHSNHIDVSFSINISGNTLNNAENFAKIKTMIVDSKVDPSTITFEVTETAAIKNIANARQSILDMKTLGCSFSMDDFGSGLCSFGYLKELPVEYLKIDGGFVREMINDPTCRAIVSAFNQLSHELNMKTIAEFVENAETEALLKELGVDYVQGYSVGKPQNAEQWVELLVGSHKKRSSGS